MPILRTENLNKHYDRLHVLKNVSFSVERGETLIILGPSGSGKSTLLRCLNQLEHIDAGTIYFEGQPLAYDRRSVYRNRRNFGMIFQSFNLFPQKTALENITLGPITVAKVSRAEAEREALAFLDKVKLGDKAHAYPAKLSGGQQQRVAIARALAMHPKVLLFDEPTSALDPETIGDVLEVMRKLAQEHTTMIVVTHELGFAREIAERIIFMDAGEIIEEGLSQELLTQPKSARLTAFLDAVIHK
ncbi:MAG TPA: amino acid ABC transporter ATP-binding protein [Candidatus Methylomirabilis sp.]|nr:amino acid ABC transporter ATP-binding protein [Candidatus Methylomirabilis sp.]